MSNTDKLWTATSETLLSLYQIVSTSFITDYKSKPLQLTKSSNNNFFPEVVWQQRLELALVSKPTPVKMINNGNFGEWDNLNSRRAKGMILKIKITRK